MATETSTVTPTVPRHPPKSLALSIALVGTTSTSLLTSTGERSLVPGSTPAQALQCIQEILSITAHELRNQLASSTLHVHLARQRLETICDRVPASLDALGDELKSLHEQLTQAASRLHRHERLVHEITDSSRSRIGAIDMSFDECDLPALVADVVDDDQHARPKCAICLHMSAQPKSFVRADADRILAVATHVLTNAIRSALADRPITLEIAQRARSVRVSGADEGSGVPGHQQRRIWECFQRAVEASAVEDSSDTEERSGLGLGLGLCICKNVIELRHGGVGRRSYPGAGATW